jgi:hypothetical protein
MKFRLEILVGFFQVLQLEFQVLLETFGGFTGLSVSDMVHQDGPQ